MSATLKCAECNRTKGVHLFYKRKTKRGYSKECKACAKKGDPYKRNLDRRYRSTYGISLGEYDKLFRFQDGRCAICRKKPAGRRLAVDHDHAIERTEGVRRSIRGLLCTMCNDYLGHIGDDPTVGNRLTGYLTSAPAKEAGLEWTR